MIEILKSGVLRGCMNKAIPKNNHHAFLFYLKGLTTSNIGRLTRFFLYAQVKNL